MAERSTQSEIARGSSSAMDRRDALGRMRRTATIVLAALAAIYAATFTVEEPSFTILLIRSMAEAGMVGGLADWFAVEALFRHPLKLPIPHTALLPRNQKRAATNIARFIDQHFLVPDQVRAQAQRTNPARRAAQWLTERSNARLLAADLSFALQLLLKHQSAHGVRIGASPELRHRLKAIAVPETLSKTISGFLKELVRSRLMDDVIAEVRTVIDANRENVSEIVRARSRWWIASPVDRGIVKVLVDGILSIMDELADRESSLRQGFDRSVEDLVAGIEQSGRIADFVAESADKYIGSPAFAEMTDSVVGKVLKQVQESMEQNPDRAAEIVARVVSEFAESLLDDPDLQDRLNARLVAGAGSMLEAARPTIVAHVTRVIEEWESDDLVAHVEREVGYDLQFIRINGAVLGALVGGALHLITGFVH